MWQGPAMSRGRCSVCVWRCGACGPGATPAPFCQGCCLGLEGIRARHVRASRCGGVAADGRHG
eukprot:1216228-Lingulodinium_polyedra.AAC.1